MNSRRISRPSARRRTTLKATLVATALTATTLAGLATPASAAPQVPTAAEYKTWLRTQAESGDTQAAYTSSAFSALSATNQSKFLKYLVDGEVLRAFAAAAAGETPETVVLADGDVVIETDQGAAPTAAASGGISTMGTAGDWSCWYNVKQKILGVTITRLNFKEWYHSTRTKVDKVYNASASHTNYNIGVSISHEPEEQWISAAGNALAYVTWHGSIIYKGFGVNIDKRHHLRCDETGIRYYYLKNI
ncbi:hypothetical protein [Streptomyces sp. N35]|uniref:hypothetical protein n=1 Tax=Streptomyces sp. N35 TaxID=2795730 RepID=UPI0018F581C9|nr:hypothetical protein [Streptomyces sp. N35]